MIMSGGSDLNHRPHLTINVGLTPYVGMSLFTKFIKFMHALDTNYFVVNKVLSGFELNKHIQEGKLDLAIHPESGNSSGEIVSVPLWKEKILPVVSINHPLANLSKPISLSELAKYESVLLTNDSVLRQKFNVLAAQKGISPNVMGEVNLIYSNLQAIELGNSWGLIYERLLNDSLVVVELNDFTMDIEFHAYYLKKRREERLLWQFIDYLKQWLNQSDDLRHYFIQ